MLNVNYIKFSPYKNNVCMVPKGQSMPTQYYQKFSQTLWKGTFVMLSFIMAAVVNSDSYLKKNDPIPHSSYIPVSQKKGIGYKEISEW